MVQPLDARHAAHLKHVGGAVHVAIPRLAIAFAHLKRQTGCTVHNLVYISGHPCGLIGRQSKPSRSDIPFEYYWAGNLDSSDLTPVLEDLVDAADGVGRFRTPHQHRDPAASRGKISQQRTAQKPGGSRQQQIRITSGHACLRLSGLSLNSCAAAARQKNN